MQLISGATTEWLRLLLLVVWPGLLSITVYRSRVPGPAFAWKDSFAIAAFFTVVNYIALLPATITVTHGPEGVSLPLYWGSVVLVFLVGPVALPVFWSWLRARRWVNRFFVAQYETAWDYYFLRRQRVFALIHLADGSLLGGYFGPGSYASLSPHPGDLYLSVVYKVNADGTFGEPIRASDGTLIRRDAYSHIEFFKAPKEEE